MGKTPKSDNTELSVEELLTGVGKLVYKLNESVESINGRLEQLETGLSSLLPEKFDSVAGQLEKTNELLADFGETGKSILKSLSESPADSLDKKTFSKELKEVSKIISKSASSMEKAVTDVISRSDDNRGKILSEKLQVIVDGIAEVTGRMDTVKDSIEEKLGKIETSTVDKVSSIDKAVENSSQYQKEQLEKMSDLLALHSVEVKDNRVRNLNRSAIMHFNNAEYELAASSLQEAMELNPENPELLANLAHIKASQGKLDEAEDYFRKALEADPNLEPAISGLGTILVHTGRAEETIDFLQKFLEKESEPSVGVMISMSRAYTAKGNHTKAISLLERAEKIAPGHPELEQELAQYRK